MLARDKAELAVRQRWQVKRPKAPVQVVTTAEVDCWIIDAMFDSCCDYHGRCTLCGKAIYHGPYLMIRYRPVESSPALSMSEREMRTCVPCGTEFASPISRP